MTPEEFGQREADRLKDSKWMPECIEIVRQRVVSVAREAVLEERKRCAAFVAAGKLDCLPDAMELAIRHGPNAAIAAGLLMEPPEPQPDHVA